MKIRIDEIHTHRGRVFTTLTITTDDGRKITIEAEHAPHEAEYDCDETAPLIVGKHRISPVRIADIAMCGAICNEGDEVEISEALLEGYGDDYDDE